MLIESENITDQKTLLRNELARNIVRFSRKITSYALLEELTELQGLFCYTYDELIMTSDEKLIEISNQILQKSTEYLTGIAEYGLSNDIILKFKESIAEFDTQRR